MEESEDAAQSAGFLLTLARKPVWLFGVAASGLGFAAQAAALGVGRLVVVQPLLVASIVFALPFGARFTGQRVGRREIVGAIAVTGGIAAFLVISNPSEGRDDAPVVEWLIAGGILGAITVALVLASRGRRPGLKAALLGTSAGILFGLVIAASGCPHTRFLLPMARFHLPLADEEETLYRVAGMYLLQGFLRRHDSGAGDTELDGLKEKYAALHIMNRALAERLRAAGREDAPVNAVVLRDLLAKGVPWDIDDSLDGLRGWFDVA